MGPSIDTRKHTMMMALLLIIGQLLVMVPVGAEDEHATSTMGPRVAETGYWREGAPLNTMRYDHTMHLLQGNGMVVIGGTDGTEALASVELYNSIIGIWEETNPMHINRTGHTSVALQNNTILVLGGYDSSGDALSSVELFDPSTITWYDLPDLPFAGGGANLSAIVLLNGSVLVVGGNSGPMTTPVIDGDASIYDIQNGTWSDIALPSTAGMGRKMFMLLNHSILMVGGSDGSPWYDSIPSSEVFDPVTGMWVDTDALSEGRYMFSGQKLGTGDVIVTGGIKAFGPGFSVMKTTEVFERSNDTWRPGPALLDARFGHISALLSDGEVLVAGGRNVTGFLNQTEIVQTKKGISARGPNMWTARTRHACIINSEGEVIVSGGLNSDGAIKDVEIFTPGVKEEEMVLEVFGDVQVPSEGEVSISAHVYNDTTGDIPGVLVTFHTDGSGSFDMDWGLTDEDGIVERTYIAPRNTGTGEIDVPVTVQVNKLGYKETTELLFLEIFPEAKGASMTFNDTINHLAYVTTYSEGSQFLEGSSQHQTVDFLGDELVIIDGFPTVVANFSMTETVDKTFTSGGLTHVHVSEMSGHYYFDYNLKGRVLTVSERTTRGHVFNGTYENWYNTSESRVMRYLPSMRSFDTTVTEMGVRQEVVNTYKVTTTTKNLDTGATNMISKLETEYKSYLLSNEFNLTNFMGVLDTRVFLDETGMVFEYHSPELGIMVQTQEFNTSGELASTKALYEFNDMVGEDPTSPLLDVYLTIDDLTMTASTSTGVHAIVTSDETPIEGATVTFHLGAGGTIGSVDGPTGPDGTLDVTFTADSGIGTTIVNITAIAEKKGYRSGHAKASLAVLEDEEPPVIIHRPVETAEEEVPVDIYIFTSDDIGLEKVELHYRIGDSGVFTSMDMVPVLGAYMATIPRSVISPPLVQYYVTAVDINGNMAIDPIDFPTRSHNISIVPKVRYLASSTIVLTGGGGAMVDIAVRGNVTVLINKVDDPRPSDPRAIGLFVELDVSGDGELLWANMTFTYRDALLGGLDENELRIYRWDDIGQAWDIVDDSGVIPSKRAVWANVTSFSIFAPRVTTIPAPPAYPDVEVPTVWITYPSDKERLEDNTVTVGGIASDDEGLRSVEVRIDDGEWINVMVTEGARTTGWSVELVVAAGEHTIQTRATDTSGNVADVDSVTIKMFVEPSTEGSEDRLLCMTGVAIVAIVVIGIYLLTGKDVEADPDEPEAHHQKVEIDEDEEEDDWLLDDLDVEKELDEGDEEE